MAEYYPLLDRAISGLTEPTAEARRSIYERARTALIGQLRRMDPPVPEDDIARESTALDEAIARVEARFDGPQGRSAGAAPDADAPPAGDGATPRAGAPDVASAPSPEPFAAQAAAARPRVPPPRLPIGMPPPVPPPSRERPVLGPRPPAGAAPDVSPGRPAAAPARSPLPPRGARPVMALRPVTPVPAERAPPEAVAPASEAADAVTAPGIEEPRAEPSFTEVLDLASRSKPDGGDGPPAAPRGRDGAARPPAPRPEAARSWRRPAVAAACAAGALVVLAIGVTAYQRRDRPEQVVATHAAAPGQADPEAAAPGKAVDRAASSGTDGAADAGAEPATSGAAVPAPVPQGSDTAAPAIAVAQRAALLVDAPDDPQRVRTYVGSVVWHLDSVNPGGGQPLASAVKADVDIPDAKLKVTMLIQKNPEPQLPASHTIEFHFLPQPGNALGPVKQINVPEMRKGDDAPTGDALAGVPVAITDNYFLVGLSRGATEGQNVRLLTDRNWFDLSVLFTSGKLGKLTFEKGVAGQRVIEDAMKAWK